MVKLTEVEDEHFTDKPTPSKHDALLVSDDEEGLHRHCPCSVCLRVSRVASRHERDCICFVQTKTGDSMVSCLSDPGLAGKIRESEISNESDDEVEEESIYDRLSALKDIVPPSARRTVTSSVSTLTNFSKASLSFSGKALWIISTSAFLIGVPWALAYAEEEQYIQMEREQGMIKGANELPGWGGWGRTVDDPLEKMVAQGVLRQVET
ncbi:Mitochondrial outer membrane translocase complex subunit Tom22 [Penicillium cinerascens]|uniref:Mitochondrial outer membrane translocase complex subunit Tom22 n=1 Tax=Penicillium cinerascens TaxID=70096 RepID=A0A9W9NGC2_9EURO|nr:Mitochondrial outer membrane translocase complex subunit Tom22 [Penicillium cinerascens]KAJ5219462.1 Mitochondrial outer membrane translocase complex subunit Tom22 [Penicillium cinerascens]